MQLLDSLRLIGVGPRFLGGLALLLLFLLPRLSGQLFLTPDLVIICFCHRPVYALVRPWAQLFAGGGEDLTYPGMPRPQIRRL